MSIGVFLAWLPERQLWGNSCNLHKSQMAAMDSGWDTIIQLVNSESCVIHLYKIMFTWGINLWDQFGD